MSDTTVTVVKTSGIGAASLSASAFNFDPTLGCDSATFQPCSERALAGLGGSTSQSTRKFPSVNPSSLASSLKTKFSMVVHHIIQHSIPQSSYSTRLSHGTASASSKLREISEIFPAIRRERRNRDVLPAPQGVPIFNPGHQIVGGKCDSPRIQTHTR